MVHDHHVPGFFDQPPSILDRLPPIERAVFRCRATEDLSIEQIARRLDIAIPAVGAFLAEALILLHAVRQGTRTEERSSPVRAQAEASLRARYRAYCEDRLSARGVAERIAWRADEDEDMTISRAIFDALDPIDLETFLLSRVDGFTYAQIARHMGTFQWIVDRRMMRVIGAIHKAHCDFGDWLVSIGRDPEETGR